ncbi:protein of unknown function [Taphrina deformans PYCC 5710]|uniref:MARVEL domain-containing protein n=1 Tax=Taphrina deformans (strain PYCC 5710 / ATCC 11124 / CBS 356.35 / IMI 108563 / JCM 9778 / NBRC 8474) TaxID=1097556 RepID=R4XDK3_TAPDE|nr:protein of unknown function [Taphrina deformans PYCC 5710]|eukprot:CCG83676.1 protein of unknown function [Taphrina deformans PYCC 5710]
MALTELILGATRAAQLLLSIVTVGLSSGTVHSLTKKTVGGHAPNYSALFTALCGLVSILFLVTSQFLFIHQYDGYNVYITTGVVLESLNWLFLFAAWVSIAQFGNSTNCDPTYTVHRDALRTCQLDRVLLAFLILSWLAWSVSLVIMVRLKLDEARNRQTTKEIEMRIKAAVETQAREHASRSLREEQADEASVVRGSGDLGDPEGREEKV